MRTEVQLSGFGGQGLVLAGYVLGKALSLHQGLEAVMTQSHGPEARGGASSSNLVVSDEPIDYPLVRQPDILVAMSQEAYGKYRPTVKPGAVVVIDESLVHPNGDDDPKRVPATELAEGLGQRIVANMVMLGFLTQVTDLVNREAVEKAIESTVRSKTVPLNLKAFAAGWEHALAVPAVAGEEVS